MKRFVILVASAVAVWAQKTTVPELLKLAQNPASPAFKTALVETLGDGEIKKGLAVAGHGSEFIWAVETASRPALFLDDGAREPMKQLAGTNIWYAQDRVRTGTSHVFHYVVEGKRFGGREFAAYTPDSYQQPGVPQGTISEKLTHTSRIYAGMESNYWIYVPAQYKADTAAALMVFQDGEGLIERESGARLQIVVDNLIHQKKIPVMIVVLIQPGTLKGKRMRSIEYDSVDDRYPRFLRDELLTEVYKKYNVRKDGYSRAIAGNSSGGICAFNAAWQQPDQFSRVLSRIGSFTSIQWNQGAGGFGGHEYPHKVRKEPKRNIRVWLQDGSEDLENEHGSWPLQNIQMANSLKMREYDFHFSYGVGAHSAHHGNAELPDELKWLWRGYDPGKTEQAYEMDPLEKTKPYFRVKIFNRDFTGQDSP